MLGDAARRSFNCVTVDGDMSTNDTVIVLANGDPEPPALSGEAGESFYGGLEQVCESLARAIAPTLGPRGRDVAFERLYGPVSELGHFITSQGSTPREHV